MRQAGFKGVICVPEPRENDWSFKESFEGQIVEWESTRIRKASWVMVWIPRHPTQLPGRVTNTELGVLIGMAIANPDLAYRFDFGYPPNAWKVKSESHWASLANKKPYTDLEFMCKMMARGLS